MKNKWTKRNLKKLAKLLKDPSKTLEEIGKEFGVTKQRIYQLSRQLNLETNLTCKKINQYTPEQWRVHRLLYNATNRLPNPNNVTIDDLLPLPTHCPLIGIEIDYGPKGCRKENSPSIDKIDNTKGYINGNVIVCSWRGNRIKNDGTLEEHKKIVEFLESIF